MIEEEEIRKLFRQHQAGRFEIKKILGIGGMGVVVQAFDRKLKVLRAIKIFNPELLANDSLVRRFENEASIMAGIEHTNIVKVYDIGEIQSHHFIVLEWIDGGSLGSLLERSGPMHPRMALLMIYYVCDALSVAHKRGIIHRDIKPDNILITKDGMPKVADFGIAHMDGDGNHPLTGVGEGLVTPGIGAPEQFSDAASVDARADVYATAVTFWMLMTAMRPPGLLFLHDMKQNPELLKNIPPCLHEILKKAVEYYPQERYATMEEFTQALRDVEDQFPPMGRDIHISSDDGHEVGVWAQTQIGATRIGSKPAISEVPEPTTFPKQSFVPEPTTFSKQPPVPEPDVPESSVEGVTPEPTSFSKQVPISERDGTTLAYRPSGGMVREDVPNVEIDFVPVVNVEEAQELPVRTETERATEPKRHRLILIMALVLFVVGSAAFVSMFLRQSETSQRIVLEQKVVVALSPDVISERSFPTKELDAGGLSSDVSIPSVVTVVVVEAKGEQDVSVVFDPVSKEPVAEKIGEKKEQKGAKLVRTTGVKASEATVPKSVMKKSEPLMIEPAKLKPETVKVQVGLSVASDDSIRAWLVGPGGRHKLPGSVAPGTYKVIAIFKDQDVETVALSKLEVTEGTTLRISCDSARELCRKI
jgi:serine/threonine protein kinase